LENILFACPRLSLQIQAKKTGAAGEKDQGGKV